jgi:hypothetical protein
VNSELSDLFAKYNDYIGHSKDKAPEDTAGSVWGEPLAFEDFTRRWEQICQDPALEQQWKLRLSAGREHAICELGRMVDRLACVTRAAEEKAA